MVIHCLGLVTDFSSSEGRRERERERERGIHVIHSATRRSTTLPQQLSSFSSSSFHGTHGLPRQKHDLAINQKMSSVPPCTENLQYNWPEHLHADLRNTLSLCYPGFSKIRDEDVTMCRRRCCSPGKIVGVKTHACWPNVSEAAMTGVWENTLSLCNLISSKSYLVLIKSYQPIGILLIHTRSYTTGWPHCCSKWQMKSRGYWHLYQPVKETKHLDFLTVDLTQQLGFKSSWMAGSQEGSPMAALYKHVPCRPARLQLSLICKSSFH